MDRILVYADRAGFDEPVNMGTLYSELIGGQEVFSFEYRQDWLNHNVSRVIDPGLKSGFRILLDSAPDSWGQDLLRRRESARAKREGREEKTLFLSDYLLGVPDPYRKGAIRFMKEPYGVFLDSDECYDPPNWDSLRELEEMSLKLAQDGVEQDPGYPQWLKQLVRMGSSLGGARPKVNVLDRDGNVWLAKFPSPDDDRDVGAWEMLVNELARRAGLNMAEAVIRKLSGHHHTYISKRFDRKNRYIRIHFASANALLDHLQGRDRLQGRDHQERAGYLDMAEFIILNGAGVQVDLEELWRRIVFSICVSNTDDHLKNHGFILTDRGWKLSPAYDINPFPDGVGLRLNITEDDNSLDLDLAMRVAGYFRIREKRAIEIMEQVKNCVGHWKNLADRLQLPEVEQEFIKNAFRCGS